MAVVGGTAISNIMQLGEVHDVRLVGDIPMGLPMPQLPPIHLIWKVAIDSIAIAIVSYTVTISMAMILAKKHNYEVRPNQELLAMVSYNFFLHISFWELTHNFSYYTGTIEHCWWCIFVRTKCNFAIAFLSSRANWRANPNCIGCIIVSHSNYSFMDCTILRSFA